MKKILSLLLAIALLAGCAATATADGKTKLVVWSFTNELQGMIEKYYVPNHPELEFEFQIYPTDGNAYTNKLDSVLSDPDIAKSEEAPDIFAVESAFIKK